MVRQHWIAVDWGTSNLRAWLMRAGGVTAQVASDKGMNGLSPEAFEPALLEVVQPWLWDREVARVIACGMIGARQGWMEAPYRFLPCRPAAADAPLPVPMQDRRLEVLILPGLAQSDPADVMRGEETQVAGFLAKHPDFEGSLCLPGTNGKWIEIRTGELLSFRTFMTGELCALISQRSVLRHSLQGEGEDEAAFLAAVESALAAPEEASAGLFSLRAEALLHGLSPITARRTPLRKLDRPRAGRRAATLAGAQAGIDRRGAIGETLSPRPIGPGSRSGHGARRGDGFGWLDGSLRCSCRSRPLAPRPAPFPKRNFHAWSPGKMIENYFLRLDRCGGAV